MVMSFLPTELYVHFLSPHAYSLRHKKIPETYTSNPISFWTTSCSQYIKGHCL